MKLLHDTHIRLLTNDSDVCISHFEVPALASDDQYIS